MAEKVLAYDRSIVRQINGYYCGPASAEIVLNSKGIHVPEATLAREIGTHTGGTDYVGLIERVLDTRVPQAQYTSVYNPTSAAAKEKFWNDLVSSIGQGWGVVANIVAPPNDYPKAVAPSTQNLRYGGGKVYHYVALMGWRVDGGVRKVWWADPGFPPNGCWVSFDQTARLVSAKGYCYAAAKVAPKPATHDDFTRDLRAQLTGSVDLGKYSGWAQLGGRTLTDAIAEILKKLGVR